jgi:ligand-binding sensor domain-containing protein
MHTRKANILWFFVPALSLLVTACEKEEEKQESYNRIHGFAISPGGEKLLATSDGLYVLNEEKGRIEPAGDGTYDLPYYDLAFSVPEGELWLASHAGAINSFTGDFLVAENSGLPGNEVNHIHFGGSDISFFATPEGLSLLDRDKWLLYTGLDDFFLDFEVTDMGTASNGFTYVSTRGGGIERFSYHVDGISGATLFDTDWTGLQSNSIHSVFIDDTLQAYGTDGGAALHFSEHTKKDWQVYTTEDGLINDTVWSVVRDFSDNWWFGTAEGISRLSGTQWTGYDVERHSLISDHVKFLAVAPDGAVWMAADAGLSKFANEQWISFPK